VELAELTRSARFPPLVAAISACGYNHIRIDSELVFACRDEGPSMPQPSQPTGPFPGAAPPTGTDSPAPSPNASEDARVGSLIGQGKYRITGKLGQGGMGVVYEAEDVLLGRRVAVKLLPASVAGNPRALERFLREARAAARLNHPNVIAVLDVDQRDGDTYIVMELIRGGSAADLVAQRGPLPWPEATRIIADACRGLAAAHAVGLIHRDIKPANILLHNGDGSRGKAEGSAPPPMLVKLADFGLAKISEQTGTSLTDTGSVLGTPDYMSPEQCRSEQLDDRSDIYSLGAAYFKLLTGQAPYVAETSLQILFAHCEKPVPDPCRLQPSIPAACAVVVQRAMAKEPSARFQSAVEMLAALEAIPGAAPLAVPLAPAANQVLPPELPTVLSQVVPIGLGSPTTALRRPSRRWLPMAIGAMGIAALLGALWIFGKGAARPAATGTSSPAPDPGLDFELTDISERGLKLSLDGQVESIAFSPDGRWLAAAVADGKGGVHLWDFRTGKEVRHLWPGQGIRTIAFTGDSKRLYAGRAGVLGFWEVGSTEPKIAPLQPGASGLVSAVAGSRQNDDFITFAINPGEGVPARVYYRGKMSPALGARAALDVPGPVGSLAVSADGKTLAATGPSGFLCLWDLRTAEKYANTFQPGVTVNGLALSAKSVQRFPGRYAGLATDQGIMFINVDTGKRDFRVREQERAMCILYAPDGDCWVAGFANGHLLLRDLTSDVVHELPTVRNTGHRAPVLSVAFAPDGMILASGGADKNVILWDLRWLRKN
jgi:serine/threonine protein kinase